MAKPKVCDTKQMSTRLRVDLLEEFEKVCESRGFIKSRAFEIAIAMWLKANSADSAAA